MAEVNQHDDVNQYVNQHDDKNQHDFNWHSDHQPSPDPTPGLLNHDNLEVATLPYSNNSGSTYEVLNAMGIKLLVSVENILDDKGEHLEATRINFSLA